MCSALMRLQLSPLCHVGMFVSVRGITAPTPLPEQQAQPPNARSAARQRCVSSLLAAPVCMPVCGSSGIFLIRPARAVASSVEPGSLPLVDSTARMGTAAASCVVTVCVLQVREV